MAAARGSEQHIPVLRERLVELLRPCLDRPDALYVDATLGLGGHVEAIVEAFPGTHVVGIDRDVHALAAARQRLAEGGHQITATHATYDDVAAVLEQAGYSATRSCHGILMDLGVSSMQLDQRERGFAYAEDAPLDMRMNDTDGVTAAEYLAEVSVGDLARVLRTYGEERFARRIAELVVQRRSVTPLLRSAQLVDLIREAIPAPARRTGGHPAKRTFQAIRIAVNDELAVLERALPAAAAALAPGGRLVVMSYHSLEDRLTKRYFASLTQSQTPVDLPFVPEGSEPEFRLVRRGAEQASETEQAANPRAASVRLRVLERIDPQLTAREPSPGSARNRTTKEN